MTKPTALWRQSHWMVKWVVISTLCLALIIAGEKVGLLVPDDRPLAPPFDNKACREALVQKDYPGLSVDELADDIQLEYRQTCSRMALDYQGYSD